MEPGRRGGVGYPRPTRLGNSLLRAIQSLELELNIIRGPPFAYFMFRFPNGVYACRVVVCGFGRRSFWLGSQYLPRTVFGRSRSVHENDNAPASAHCREGGGSGGRNGERRQINGATVRRRRKRLHNAAVKKSR